MAIPAVDANLAVFTVFAWLADTDVLSQLQIIRDLASFIRGFMEQDVLASIDAFILFIIFTSFRTAFYSQCCMRSAGFISFCTDVVVDFLQITKVSCILQSIAGRCSNRSIFTFCILGTIESTLDVRDLVTTDIDITASDSSRAISTKGNLSAGGLAAFGLLVADGCDTRQIFCQLDFQLAFLRAVDADVAFRQVLAVCTTNDIESAVQLLSNNLRCIFLCIIASILHAVFHSSYLVVASLIGVDDTGNAIFAVNAIGSVDTFCSIIIAVLDGDIDSSTILAVRPGRACQADMADTIFTGNGNSIFAILAGDTDFAVSTICTFRAGNGDTIFARCTIFTIQTADSDAVGAVQADMAILAVDANLTIFTIFARLTDIDILGQLQIIRNLAIFICGFVEQDVLASIDIFVRLFILGTS